MDAQILHHRAQLDTLAARWKGLTLPSPMQSPAWLLSWWDAYARSDEAMRLSIIAAWEGDRLAGLAPFYTHTHPVWGTTLRWLGDGRASSDHSTILCHSPEDEPAVVMAVARTLVERASRDWQRLRLESCDADDRATAQLFRLLGELGLDTEWVPTVSSHPAPLASDWEEFLASVSKNRRKRLRRWTRDYFDTGRATVRRAETSAEVEQLWPTLQVLHRERRVAMGEEGVFDCPHFDAFHRSASAQLIEQDELYLALLELDGKPAAIEYALQDSHAIYAYQGGIANWALSEDAGHLSAMAMVKHAITTGRTTLDLLRGDEPYKASWGAQPLAARTLHARPKNLTGTLERWIGHAYRGLRDAGTRTETPSAE